MEPPGDGPRFASSGPALVECPSEVSAAVRDTIGAAGGTIQLRNHVVSLPVLAVALPTEFRVTDRAGKYVELNVKAAGQESFVFDEVVTVTLDYSRCTRSNIDQAPLSVWKIDPSTKALVRQMEVVAEDKASRTITFRTLTLSSWSIAE